MGRYQKIECKIWRSSDFRSLSDDGKLAFLLCLTHSELTSVGAMYLNVAGLAAELGWSTERLTEGLTEGLKKGLIRFSLEHFFLYLPNWFRYNQPASLNVIKSWPKLIGDLPECELKHELLQRVMDIWEDLEKTFSRSKEDLTKVRAKVFSPIPIPIPTPIPTPNPNPILKEGSPPEKNPAADKSGKKKRKSRKVGKELCEDLNLGKTEQGKLLGLYMELFQQKYREWPEIKGEFYTMAADLIRIHGKESAHGKLRAYFANGTNFAEEASHSFNVFRATADQYREEVKRDYSEWENFGIKRRTDGSAEKAVEM